MSNLILGNPLSFAHHHNRTHKPNVQSSNFSSNRDHISVTKLVSRVLKTEDKLNKVNKFNRGVCSNCMTISTPYNTKGIAEDEIEQSVESIRLMLKNMDGETSISAYDTAWVALIDNVGGGSHPQFPSCLQWIAGNQLDDGSWGELMIFSAYDRLINTLACIVALKYWSVHPEKCEKGLMFFRESIKKLEVEIPEHMPLGFELTFTSLLEKARNLKLEVPYDSPVLQDLYSRRDYKLSKIPKGIFHTVPTSLIYSLEGIKELIDWEKLLKLQCEDGSFQSSPASTAFAFMETKDQKCLRYLTKVVHKFNGGAPCTYPFDLFENLWVVDRLQRLGISRYFCQEIKERIHYVHRYWTEKGIGWARNSGICDVDDTAMGFRLLRLHGYKISADVFRNFKKDGDDQFFYMFGQTSQAVTGIYNLFRASQLLFPGESILETAKAFSSEFLRKKKTDNKLIDKWIITKDLPGEVGYALDVPWYANLPRVESSFFIEQYGGKNDVWIGKVLYRMLCVNNDEFVDLAKNDFNLCQQLHSIEWYNLQKWYTDCRLGDYGLSRNSLLVAYYLAAASIFEAERADERLAWAKTAALIETISSHFNVEKTSTNLELRKLFAQAFLGTTMPGYLIPRGTEKLKLGNKLLESLLATLRSFSIGTITVYRRDISHQLHQAWGKWLLKWQDGEDEENCDTAELFVQTINLVSARTPLDGMLSNPHYNSLFNITNSVCNKILRYQKQKSKIYQNGSCNKSATTEEIESEMQELVRLVLENSSIVDAKIKETFLMVTKTFYYAAYFDAETINFHIDKVLFKKVE